MKYTENTCSVGVSLPHRTVPIPAPLCSLTSPVRPLLPLCAVSADDRGIDIGCWSIDCHRGTISSSAEIDAFSDETAVKPPEMVFLANHLTLTHKPTGAHFSFNTRDALKGCLLDRTQHAEPTAAGGSDSSVTPPLSSSVAPSAQLPSRQEIRVTHAKYWKGKEHDVNVQTLNLAYDWTYTTHYRATLAPPPPQHSLTIVERSEPLPLHLLQRPDPILWYCQLPLYDDELHDNGVCSVSVKARVMASCWLVLMQCWLRVDDVCVKVYETRLYCQQMTGDKVEVIREWQAREETFESLASRGMPRDSKSYTDPSFVARKLPLLAQTRELITIQ